VSLPPQPRFRRGNPLDLGTSQWVQVSQGVLPVAYGPDGWVAQQTSTLSDGTAFASDTRIIAIAVRPGRDPLE
jgi:hypothetical protein